ncbi:MAG: hypothetical protein IPK08_00990 [Bacteroidetes bacterium]|nr:hypothetical protein [Bacteroidota bacterium]
MSSDSPTYSLILQSLAEKAPVKMNAIQKTEDAFKELKLVLKKLELDINKSLAQVDKRIVVSYHERGPFDIEFRIYDDILIFSMHSNVYTFEDSHHIHKSSYVKEKPFNGYCGMISIYNFLTDSFQYKRGNDLGLLIARIFINQENHFFVEGKRHLGIEFNDFDNDLIEPGRLNSIVEAAILHCLNFDIQTPPFDKVGAITVQEVMEKELATVVSTGKRLGFKFQSESGGVS